MTWTDPDTDGATYLKLLKAGERRSAMETRHGQRAALERMQEHWEKAQGKQARARALAGLTFATQLVPKPQVRPLQWVGRKTGTGGD